MERHLYTGYYKTTMSLKDMVRRYCGVYLEKDTRDDFISRDTMTQEMRTYAAKDAYYTQKIAHILERERAGMDFRAYDLVNAPAIWMFLDMPPVRIDKDLWLRESKKLQAEGEALQTALGINVNSPKQVVAFVEAQLGKKMRNTRKDTLEQLALDPFDEEDGGVIVLKRIIRARSLLKMGSTYGESFLSYVGSDGYVLPGWKLDQADTGRTACADPPMHNVPVREYPGFRKAVIASKGCTFSVSDASAQEVRIGCWWAQDPTLLRLFNEGGNIYVNVAKEMLGETITKKDKRYDKVKAVVLGTNYGLTPAGLAKREHISKAEAVAIQEQFFATFNRVPAWMHRMRQQAISRGYVTTPLNRRLWINTYDDQWLNNAVNSPVQGGAAEMTKLSLNINWQMCQDAGMEFRIPLQIHDEIDADAPTKLMPKYDKITKAGWMEAAKVIIPGVPMVVEFAHGQNWACKQ
jgi:DNA polymerase-1